MAKRNRWHGPRKLNGQQQGAILAMRWPNFRQVSRGNPTVWQGELQPLSICATYLVRISFFHGLRPQIEILNPKVVPRVPGGAIPHTFEGTRPCLHLPEEWDASKLVAETIIPWTSLWLYYYEMWHATGDWLGGGHVFKTSDESKLEI